jgi:HSP20 family protein
MAEERKEKESVPAKPWQMINPFDTMREAMNRMMDTIFEPLSRLTPPELRVPVRGFVPNIDVIEEDEHVRIDVEAPGMSPEDLSVTLTEESVIIRGEKKSEASEAAGVHRAERCYGCFRRAVPLPVEVDRDKVEAAFKNGVLTITLPKSGEKAKKVTIKVEKG